jgi:hypothetical protein
VLKAWFVTEAAWRHNRLHLFLAAVALVQVVAFHDLPSLVIATVVVGGLMLRVYLWDLRRTDSRLALRRIPRHESHS